MGKHRKLAPGDAVEHLRLIENLGLRELYGHPCTYWLCECLRCGNRIEVPVKTLGTGVKDCGCWRSIPKKPIEPGTRFGRLTVLRQNGNKPGRGALYDCLCDCGNTVTAVRGSSLRSGETTSCGCVHDERFAATQPMNREKNFVLDTSLGHAGHRDDMHQNNTSGYRNVYWHKARQRWCVRIAYRKKVYYLGYYADIEEAARVAEQAREEIKEDFEQWYAAYLAAKKANVEKENTP